MQRKIYLLLIVALAMYLPSHAQISTTALKGKVTDKETGETLPFVNVVVFLNGNLVTGATTDLDGEFTIKPIDPGTYDVQFSYIGYTTQNVKGVLVKSNIINYVNAILTTSVELDVVEIVDFTVPLIDKDGGASGGTVTRDEIEKMPGRSALGFASTVAGVGTTGTGGGISIRGARTDATWVYIDGIKVRGSAALPKSAIEEVSVITGGIPASIGDATGGVINISTRNSSSMFTGGLEVITSGFGEIGLDHYGYNLLEGSLSGPLLHKKDSTGTKIRPILGFFLSANITSIEDPNPAYGGNYKMKFLSQQSILNDPLRQNVDESGVANGALFNADFLNEDDFEKVNTNMNIANRSANIVAKIDVNTSENMTLTFGGTGAFSKYHAASYGNRVMNWENNAEITELDWRTYVKFSQNFKNDDKDDKATLKNVYYSVMVDYSRTYDRNQDDTHQEELFKYGHVGYFDIFRLPTYTANDFGTYYVQEGTQDVNVSFTPSPYNSDLAAITNQYFGLFDLSDEVIESLNGQDLLLTDDPIFNPITGTLTDEIALISDDPYSNYEQIQGGNGLINGATPPATYGLWSYIGTPNNNYSIGSTGQFRVTAAGSADIKDHAIQIGFEYEQRRDAFYGVSPVGLWGLGRLLLNSHTRELDKSDSTKFNVGSTYYVNYDQLVGDGQFEFDYNLRSALGLDPYGNDFVNIDAIDPSQLSIDMFGAEDLLNGGNNYVIYYGYDHKGNKLKGKPSIDDFFTEQYTLGNKTYFTRPMGAFEPIYTSGYIMDKFAFDDLIFNVGVRIDRYDANQPVPKDPYVINEAYTAGETNFEAFNAVRPSNIGDDFVVYVNDLKQPTGVVGYRDNETWYNAAGQEISDPDLIAVGGRTNPYLKTNPDDPLTANAFRDYKPSVIVMPRIAFSFPISDEALFFAHYDILTQRPNSSNRFNPIDYLYMEGRNVLINNPDLKPEKTVDYALGFQQILSRTSSIKVEAFYREMRDMIQVRSFNGAYPSTYRAFGNLDFGTVKGLTLTYDLRKTGNIWIKTSYTLQFADGTGSTTQTALALINAGLPNLRTISPLNYDQRHRIVTTLDYRYGEGKDYNGPLLFGKPFLKNTGANFIANLGSGTPYTASTIATPVDGSISPSTEGSINGSRLPWQFTIDLNLDRNFNLKFGEGDDAKTANLNVYLWVSNLLNTRNVFGVYRFTGVPDDDGYLAAAQYQPQINTQTDPSAYRNYYSMFVDNPYNLGAPRTIRLGVRFDF